MEKRFPVYKHIPNLLTLMNLCSGFLSIVFIFFRNLEAAAFFIIIASVFDFLDGFLARLLKATSQTGKILDTLSDVVSFGVAPAAIIFLIIEFSLIQSITDFSFSTASFIDRLILLSPIIILIASALRLAAFAVNEETAVFSGMPTPATALFIAGLALIISDPQAQIISSWLLKLYLLIPVFVLLSFLMISKIRFISFKFKHFGFRQNRIIYIFIASSLILLILLQKFAVSLIIVLYIIISVVSHLLSKPSDL